ncbi:anti-repressor SinI family protein [Sutcliffiella halmapala]|nr:anti-repressor SinI family protein [Sutcliffiella halmapala]
MEKVSVNLTENLDKEWVELISDALNMGISSEEIREFLHSFTPPIHQNL